MSSMAAGAFTAAGLADGEAAGTNGRADFNCAMMSSDTLSAVTFAWRKLETFSKESRNDLPLLKLGIALATLPMPVFAVGLVGESFVPEVVLNVDEDCHLVSCCCVPLTFLTNSDLCRPYALNIVLLSNDQNSRK